MTDIRRVMPHRESLLTEPGDVLKAVISRDDYHLFYIASPGEILEPGCDDQRLLTWKTNRSKCGVGTSHLGTVNLWVGQVLKGELPRTVFQEGLVNLQVDVPDFPWDPDDFPRDEGRQIRAAFLGQGPAVHVVFQSGNTPIWMEATITVHTVKVMAGCVWGELDWLLEELDDRITEGELEHLSTVGISWLSERLGENYHGICVYLGETVRTDDYWMVARGLEHVETELTTRARTLESELTTFLLGELTRLRQRNIGYEPHRPQPVDHPWHGVSVQS